MSNEQKDLKQALERIEASLERMESEMKEMNQKIEQIRTSNRNMDEHIDFINGAYNRYNSCLNYINDRFHYFIGGNSAEDKKSIESDNSDKETDE